MGLGVMLHGSADGDDGPFPLASASGWQLFCQWVEQRLHSGRDGDVSYQPLRDLCSDGEYTNSSEVAKALELALDHYLPSSQDVRHTAEGLASVIGVGADDETVTVVNESIGDEPQDGPVTNEEPVVNEDALLDEVAVEYGLTEQEKAVLRDSLRAEK